jgi:hypothetical protein
MNTAVSSGLARAIWLISLLLMLSAPAAGFGADAPPKISAAKVDGDGFLRHDIDSNHQAGTTAIRVLLPDAANRGVRSRVLLVLPVEPGLEHHYGDGLAEVRRLEVHNRHQLICVEPTFAALPWYADHPTDSRLRQETYLLEVVLPFLKREYGVSAECDSWLLLGFSKSGWGAWSLLLRHPELFGRAAAWDAPMAMHWPSKFGSQPIFATEQNFERYEIFRLLKRESPRLHATARLGLFGYGNFREQHEQTHSLMQELGIAHVYRDGPQRKHDWSSGWIAEAVEFLVADSTPAGR